MKVEFKYGWFGPNAIFYDKGIQEVPDDFYDVLPSTASLISAEPERSTEKVKSQSLKDFDELRANSDATMELLNKFEKEKVK
jgi:hypothetical protein